MNTFRKAQNDSIYQKLKDSISIEDAADALGLQLTRSGHSLQGNCPKNHPSDGGKCFSINTQNDYFKCFSCGIKGDVIKLVMETKNISPREAAAWLNVEFEVLTKDEIKNFQYPSLSEEEINRINQEKEKSILYEEAYKWMHESLFQEEGKEALNYLVNDRGYDGEVLKQTEWCYFPPIYKIKEHLIQMFPDAIDQINELPFYGAFGDNFRAAFPFRDIKGNITGFVKRACTPLGIEFTSKEGKISYKRWDSTKGLTKKDLFNLYSCTNEKNLLLVEGYPDALYLSKVGLKDLDIVALGQAAFSEDYFEGLRIKKIKNIILALDNDETGHKNTSEIIKVFHEKSSINVYVINPENFGTHKDPDGYIKANGLGAFENFISQKLETGGSYLIKNVIKNLEQDNILQREEKFQKCIEILSNIKNPNELSFHVPEVAKAFKVADKNIKTSIERKKDKQRIENYGNIKENIDERYFPFFEKKSCDYAYYDRIEDQVYLGISKEKLKDLLCSAGQTLPDPFKVLKAEFEIHQDERINLKDEIINLFSPTKYMLMSKTDDKLGNYNFPTISKLLSNLFPVKEEQELFINWLAGIMQTRKKQRTSWVLKGAQGAGKGILLDKILTKLFGNEQVIKAENSDLLDQFNGWLQNKIIVAFNEVANDKKTRDSLNSKIKATITDDYIQVNDKFIRKFRIQNHASYLFFSNEFNPITIEEKDRRFNVVITGGDLMKESWFANAPEEALKNIEEEVFAFSQYLWNWNYDAIKANTPLRNQAKEEMLVTDMNPYEELAFRLKNQDIDWISIQISDDKKLERLTTQIKNRYISKEDIRILFNEMSNQFVNPVEFGKKMKSYGLKDSKKVVDPNTSKQIPVYIW